MPRLESIKGRILGLVTPAALWLLLLLAPPESHGFATHRTSVSRVRVSTPSINYFQSRSKCPISSVSLSETYSKSSNEISDDDENVTTTSCATIDGDLKNQEIIDKRQRQVQNGYRMTGFIYIAVAVYDLVQKGIHSQSLYQVMGGPVLLAGLSFLLQHAAKADAEPPLNGSAPTNPPELSLASHTCKRFNWMLLGHSMITLSLPLIDPPSSIRLLLVPSAAVACSVMILPSLTTLWNAGKGYVYGGVIGWIPKRHICAVFTDIQEGWDQGTLPILLRRRNSRESWTYMLLGSVVGAMTLAKAKQAAGWIGLGVLSRSSYSPMALISHLSRLARLMVLLGMVFSLKDAVDRDLLATTPFWQLNALVAGTMASLAGYLLWAPLSLGGINNIRVTSSVALGVVSLLFSGITGYHAVRGLRSSSS
jgi:hypothetical protein